MQRTDEALAPLTRGSGTRNGCRCAGQPWQGGQVLKEPIIQHRNLAAMKPTALVFKLDCTVYCPAANKECIHLKLMVGSGQRIEIMRAPVFAGQFCFFCATNRPFLQIVTSPFLFHSVTQHPTHILISTGDPNLTSQKANCLINQAHQVWINTVCSA